MTTKYPVSENLLEPNMRDNTATQYREKGLYSALCFCYVYESDVKVMMCVTDEERITFITRCCKPTQRLN